MKYWALILDNFEGQDEVLYFENYKIAKKNFKAVCEKYQNYEEFLKDRDFCEWYNPLYNEYNTAVYLRELEAPKIYNEILF